MNSRELAANIKQSLTMRQVVELYGFTPDRAGFIHCPFHAGDNQGSLKVYDGQGGFCCFGCGQKGSVIDFVMKLHDCNFIAACETLNRDFSLGLPVNRKQTIREYRDMRKRYLDADRKRKREEAEQRQYDRKYNLLLDIWTLYDRWKRDYAPSAPDSPIDPRFAVAVKNIDFISNRIDYEL